MNETKKIDTYIGKLPDWSRTIATKLRELIHEADPYIEEKWKWGQPAVYHKAPVCFLWAFPNHISLGFFQGALIADTHKLFNYGQTNKQNRMIKFTRDSKIPAQKITAYIKKAVKNAQAGKHVHIPQAKNKKVMLPDWLKLPLDEEGLLEKYENQIYTYRKGYLQWIQQAKRDVTKHKRIEIMLRELHEGKTYMGMPRS